MSKKIAKDDQSRSQLLSVHFFEEWGKGLSVIKETLVLWELDAGDPSIETRVERWGCNLQQGANVDTNLGDTKSLDIKKKVK